MTNKYWNGMEVCVVANEVPGMRNKAIIRIVKNYEKPMPCDECIADTIVDKDSLEPLVTDSFKLNDHVKVINGSMIGTVVGFEPCHNKAVVMSDKIKNYTNDRTRYSYKSAELMLYNDDEIKLAPGCWYKVNYGTGNSFSSQSLISVQSVFNEDEIMLFNKEGKIIFNSLSKTASKQHLKAFNHIQSIELKSKI